ncbi:unnamed protein product [Gongylonema pulchrum]|uniref:TAZ-type domain-containing protein n=1 Tax=Gongylonema pulchrum TaxID=637853 RepID=A0A183DCL0_9BILA|nr:unnamed protein product [Gongylonema pulchrum]
MFSSQAFSHAAAHKIRSIRLYLFEEIIDGLCSHDECHYLATAACQRQLPCGHFCGGIRDEEMCLPCMHCRMPGTDQALQMYNGQAHVVELRVVLWASKKSTSCQNHVLMRAYESIKRLRNPEG